MNKTHSAKRMAFSDRSAFRAWLDLHGQDHDGIWIIGYKDNKIENITYAEALEEALCYGWIDGIVKNLDEATYIRYFAPRKPDSYFSKKNRLLVDKLASEGRMAPPGWAAIARAKEKGRYDGDRTDETILDHADEFLDLLVDEGAKAYFTQLSNSSKKAYLGFYYSAKTEVTRNRRLERIKVRLIEKMPLPL